MERGMQSKVRAFIEEYHMVKEGDQILAAVSGGADSLCLLMVLQELQEEKGYGLCVVHVEHGIRGEESQRDAEFVEGYCKGQGIPCKVYHCRAADYAREHRMTLEEGARILRYGFFRKAAEAYGANKIAVAHNQNDCAETMLFQLARGSGLRGLQGILPARAGMALRKADHAAEGQTIIRPLLCVERKEIEAYLMEKGQGYCNDRTNGEMEYARNKIRHQVLPVLEEVNSRAVAHMGKASFAVAEALEVVGELVQEAEGKYVREQEGGIFISQEVLAEKKLIRTSLLHNTLTKAAESSQDISEIHIRQMSELLERQVGRELCLPYNIKAERVYGGILVAKRQAKKAGMQQQTSPCKDARPGSSILLPKGTLELPDFGYRICTKIIENSPDFEKIPKKMYTKWLDYDKIKGIMQLRTRQSKDFLVITADGKRKKLKNYLIDEKIPRQERDSILLLVDETHVLWAIGWRISEDVKVTEHTKRILEIQVQGEGTHKQKV